MHLITPLLLSLAATMAVASPLPESAPLTKRWKWLNDMVSRMTLPERTNAALGQAMVGRPVVSVEDKPAERGGGSKPVGKPVTSGSAPLTKRYDWWNKMVHHMTLPDRANAALGQMMVRRPVFSGGQGGGLIPPANAAEPNGKDLKSESILSLYTVCRMFPCSVDRSCRSL